MYAMIYLQPAAELLVLTRGNGFDGNELFMQPTRPG